MNYKKTPAEELAIAISGASRTGVAKARRDIAVTTIYAIVNRLFQEYPEPKEKEGYGPGNHSEEWIATWNYWLAEDRARQTLLELAKELDGF